VPLRVSIYAHGPPAQTHTHTHTHMLAAPTCTVSDVPCCLGMMRVVMVKSESLALSWPARMPHDSMPLHMGQGVYVGFTVVEGVGRMSHANMHFWSTLNQAHARRHTCTFGAHSTKHMLAGTQARGLGCAAAQGQRDAHAHTRQLAPPPSRPTPSPRALAQPAPSSLLGHVPHTLGPLTPPHPTPPFLCAGSPRMQ